MVKVGSHLIDIERVEAVKFSTSSPPSTDRRSAISGYPIITVVMRSGYTFDLFSDEDRRTFLQALGYDQDGKRIITGGMTMNKQR